MKFVEWSDGQPRGALTKIQRETGVGYTTLMRLRRGELLSDYCKAKVISEATGGAVSIGDLCEPDLEAAASGEKVRR